MDWVFWVIIAVIGLATVTASVIVLRQNRTQLPAPEQPAELAAEPDEAEPAAPESAPSEPEPAEEPAADVPEAPQSRFARLRRRLFTSSNGLARALADLLSSDKIDAEVWDDFEATLIGSDLGVSATTELTDALRKDLAVDGVSDPAKAREILHRELLKLVDPSMDRSLNLAGDEDQPAVVLVVGVNGTGKTTTVGKLGRMLVAEDKTVLFGAADTFRAAAAEQLTTWGERVGAQTIRGTRAPTQPQSHSMQSQPAKLPASMWSWSTPPADCTTRWGSWTSSAR